MSLLTRWRPAQHDRGSRETNSKSGNINWNSYKHVGFLHLLPFPFYNIYDLFNAKFSNNLCWNRGKVGEPEEVDQPDAEDEADEWLLGYEVDTGEVDGEEKTDDGHQHSELNTVQHEASN